MEITFAITVQSVSFNYPLSGSLVQGSPCQRWGMFSPTSLPSFSIFSPVICKLQTVNSAGKRQGQWCPAFTFVAVWEGCFSGFSLSSFPACEKEGKEQNASQITPKCSSENLKLTLAASELVAG